MATDEVSLTEAAELLDVNRTSAYYVPPAPSEVELVAKNKIDQLHTDNLAWGSRQISKCLQREGICVKISMDGKSRWAGNIMIEHWFRTLIR